MTCKLAAMLSLLGCFGRAWLHGNVGVVKTALRRPYAVPLVGASTMSHANVNDVQTEAQYRALEELASRVVQGTAHKVVASNLQLRRKRSWDLFLCTNDQAAATTAVLAVSKKSVFTIDDATAALSIVKGEVAASGLRPAGKVLLVTRAGVAPAADALLQATQSASLSDTGTTTYVVHWDKLRRLTQSGRLGKYLVGAASSTAESHVAASLSLKAAAERPTWLLEKHERKKLANFHLEAPFEPSGDQPQAIEALARGLKEGKRHQTLLGATGTGKTFIVANVIQRAQVPTLIVAPNKVLAAQLTNELRALFPTNAVEYFVSYYDYYMPEAFVSASDTYIDKVVQINDDIDRMRHSATKSLLERRDVIVVASVSCIYGLGMPAKYLAASTRVAIGDEWVGGWTALAQHLEQNLSYSPAQDDKTFEHSPRGSFRAASDGSRGGIVHIGPSSDENIVRITVDSVGVVTRIEVVPAGQHVELNAQAPLTRLSQVPVIAGIEGARDLDETARTGRHTNGQEGEHDVESFVLYPAKHHVIGAAEMEGVLKAISTEMEVTCSRLVRGGRLLEAERLRQRTENDLLLLRAVGTCKGIENYSRHLAARDPGEPPETLIDYFPKDNWLLVVDESHVSAPQLGAMFGGDRARKAKLVEHGFRLPSALDNRPLKAGEFWSKVNQAIFVSATPGKLELELSNSGHRQSESQQARARLVPTTGSCDDASPTGAIVNEQNGSTEFGWDAMQHVVDAQAVIRPTGITDPPIDIRPSEGQVANLVQECQARKQRGERVLVTALTKRMAEDLCAFLIGQGVPTTFLHSDIKPMHRLKLLQQLRRGDVDVIVGVNLLREGLNLPEVALVCVLDADAEGFLRSDTALLQTIGRATRHEAGRAVLYADRVTPSMQRALAETDRRRDIQIRYNERNGVTPKVARAVSDGDSLLDSISSHDPEPLPSRDGNWHADKPGALWNLPEDDIAVEREHRSSPEQVQQLYDVSARNGAHMRRRKDARSNLSTSDDVVSTADTIEGQAYHTGKAPGAMLVPNENNLRAMKRLAEQAAEKMSMAASKTNFKEAAMWRDRRDALLVGIREIDSAAVAHDRDLAKAGQTSESG